jgi:SNF2 family DNA or RNA helicase
MLGEKLVNVLTDQPPFSDQNFKSVLMQAYQKVTSKMRKILDEQRIEEEPRFTVPIIPKAIMNEEWRWQRWEISENYTPPASNTKKSRAELTHRIDQPPDTQWWIERLPLSQLEGYDRYVASWVLGHHVALELLARGAFLPRLVQIGAKRYKMQWIPSEMEPTVKRVIEHLTAVMPPDVIRVQEGNFLHPNEQVRFLLGIWFEAWLRILVPDNVASTAIGQLFFRQATLSTDTFETQHLPEAIELWLRKWHLVHREWIPVFQVLSEDPYFEITMSAKSGREHLVPPIALATFLAEHKNSEAKTVLLQDLAQLTEQFPQLSQVIESRGKEVLLFDNESFVNILLEILPTLRLLGIPILLPKELEQLIKPQVSLKVKSAPKSNKTFTGLDQMLSFDWQVALGDKLIGIEEFRKLVRDSRGIVRFKDQFIYVNEAEIVKLMKALEKSPELSQAELLKTSLSGEYQGAKIELSEEAQELLTKLLTIPELATPDTLQATLREYQKRGWTWLYHNSQFGFGSLLADDMGLGKTIQIITLLLKWQHEKKIDDAPVLIIVPTTLLTNWVKECNKFAPELKTWVYHGQNRKLPQEKVAVVLTSYGLIRSDINKFSSLTWSAVILDEAQNIKTATTAQTKAVKQLKSPVKIALTGTPVENRLSEYFSIFEFINFGYLGSQKQFNEEFAKPIELERNQRVVERFRKITGPFIRRRLKTDKTIITDLPEKISTDEFCQLTKQQTALYQSLVDQTMNILENSEGIERLGLVFKLMTGLKQICNHPAQYLKQSIAKTQDSGKTQLLLDLLQSIYESQQKVLIFTQYTQMGELLVRIIRENLQDEPLFFHGGLLRNKRDALVTQFQEVPQIKTMILSLKAGGTGLNLTAASHVIHFDLWWNPAVEAQATDRAYRIGQLQRVNVHRFITTGTFEEKINDMIQAKKELADLTVTSGEKWIGELSNNELKELFKLDLRSKK